MSAPKTSPSSGHHDVLKTVRYSLPEMLTELKEERLSGALGAEKLQQAEIGKLYQTQPKRRRAKANR